MSMQCFLCGKPALYKVHVTGYCREHRPLAVHDLGIIKQSIQGKRDAFFAPLVADRERRLKRLDSTRGARPCSQAAIGLARSGGRQP